MQKGPICPESLSYEKKDGPARHDTEFLDFFRKKAF